MEIERDKQNGQQQRSSEDQQLIELLRGIIIESEELMKLNEQFSEADKFYELRRALIGCLVRIKVQDRPMVLVVGNVEERQHVQQAWFGERRIFVPRIGYFGFEQVEPGMASADEIYEWIRDRQQMAQDMPTPQFIAAKQEMLTALLDEDNIQPKATAENVEASISMNNITIEQNASRESLNKMPVQSSQQLGNANNIFNGLVGGNNKVNNEDEQSASDEDGVMFLPSRSNAENGRKQNEQLDGEQSIDALVHSRELLERVLMPYNKLLNYIKLPPYAREQGAHLELIKGCLTGCRKKEQIWIDEVNRVTGLDIYFKHGEKRAFHRIRPLETERLTDQVFANWIEDMTNWNEPLPNINEKLAKKQQLLALLEEATKIMAEGHSAIGATSLRFDGLSEIIVGAEKLERLYKLDREEFAQVVRGLYVHNMVDPNDKIRANYNASFQHFIFPVVDVSFDYEPPYPIATWPVGNFKTNVRLHYDERLGLRPNRVWLVILKNQKKNNKPARRYMQECLDLMRKTHKIPLPSKEFIAQKKQQLNRALAKAHAIDICPEWENMVLPLPPEEHARTTQRYGQNHQQQMAVKQTPILSSLPNPTTTAHTQQQLSTSNQQQKPPGSNSKRRLRPGRNTRQAQRVKQGIQSTSAMASSTAVSSSTQSEAALASRQSKLPKWTNAQYRGPVSQVWARAVPMPVFAMQNNPRLVAPSSAATFFPAQPIPPPPAQMQLQTKVPTTALPAWQPQRREQQQFTLQQQFHQFPHQAPQTTGTMIPPHLQQQQQHPMIRAAMPSTYCQACGGRAPPNCICRQQAGSGSGTWQSSQQQNPTVPNTFPQQRTFFF